MCGRFTLTATPEEVADLLGLTDIDDFPPRYNIAPTQPILMVTGGHPQPAGSNQTDRRCFLVRWGFLPGWAKDPRSVPLLFNARSEEAAEKGTFRAAMRHRRTLVPATGFYEWRREKGRTGQAYFVRPVGGGIVAFAGLMETWHEPGGSEIDTGAILTTAATGALADIHHRAPVVIRPQDFARWLDCRGSEPRDVADLMRPAEPDEFEAIAISDRVNKVANVGPDVQAAVETAPPAAAKPDEPAGSEQLTLF
ncbi:MAG: SOS response-associated peptidase [Rhizobiaceae bacterium]|nr:SOS response-associated peptidase [Rhizobiaceae bacterium]